MDREQPASGLAPCCATVHLTATNQPTIASDGKRNWASAYTSLLMKNGSSMRGELRAAGSCDEPGRRQDAGCEDREGAVG